MNLFYWAEKPNFGDALNPWLWPKIFPGAFDKKDDIDFFAIGTLLNAGIQQGSTAKTKLVFGTGAGNGKSLELTPNWKFYFVRGPLSARELNLPPDKAISDPALLVRRFFDWKNVPKTHKVSFMPHWYEDCQSWRDVCKVAGINFIDPLQPVEATLREIAASEKVIAEAMHCAIIADAFRVPWIPLATHPGPIAFKWDDWSQSVKINSNHKFVRGIYDRPTSADFFLKLHHKIRFKLTYKALAKLAQAAPGSLSNEKHQNELEDQMSGQIEILRRDLATNKL